MKIIKIKLNKWSEKHPMVSFTLSTALTGLTIIGVLIWCH